MFVFFSSPLPRLYFLCNLRPVVIWNGSLPLSLLLSCLSGSDGNPEKTPDSLEFFEIHDVAQIPFDFRRVVLRVKVSRKGALLGELGETVAKLVGRRRRLDKC